MSENMMLDEGIKDPLSRFSVCFLAFALLLRQGGKLKTITLLHYSIQYQMFHMDFKAFITAVDKNNWYVSMSQISNVPFFFKNYLGFFFFNE